ncbi:MAG: Uma2 family endonuclease [Treponema sp.]|jgi:Uma2 family endonuclease|nr:Uma2 family endonuclease [Treponema sp.]
MADAMQADYSGENERFTYADYLEWEGPERYQLLNGKAFLMASPSVEHQAMLMELLLQFHAFLRGKPCRVFAVPLDVRPFPAEDNSDDTVVQPDLLVVCDRDRLGKGSVNGPPDLAIEIVSPSNSHRELFAKLQIYLEAGVREYWVIEPEERRVMVHIYEDGHYLSYSYKGNAVIPVTILPGLSVALESIFSETPA